MNIFALGSPAPCEAGVNSARAKAKLFSKVNLASILHESRPDDILFAGFPWSTLPGGRTVVDVAGGTGHVTLAIAETVPHLKFVVQDRQEVIEGDAPAVSHLVS